MKREFPNGTVLELVLGDITKVPVDAISNAANSGLRGGGGVDGAIHRAGGPPIMADLDKIRTRQGGCPTGQAVATTAGLLPAKYVFHAVGPVYRDGKSGEPDLLRSAYESCLRLAVEHGIESISFPSISTGIYGYPVEEAAKIAIAAVSRHLSESDGPLRKAIFVLFDQRTLDAYANALR